MWFQYPWGLDPSDEDLRGWKLIMALVFTVGIWETGSVKIRVAPHNWILWFSRKDRNHAMCVYTPCPVTSQDATIEKAFSECVSPLCTSRPHSSLSQVLCYSNQNFANASGIQMLVFKSSPLIERTPPTEWLLSIKTTQQASTASVPPDPTNLRSKMSGNNIVSI